ncbi:MAG: AAA family ATPase [Saprospiraceae bacterium]|jgi:predicted ATP-binding protein involved in virulence|nr:AAA family ATPase [Saprospiraceae bacterium]
MKINKLNLKNFRSFENFEVKFPQKITALIGPNGAGKTSILDAIAICMTHFTGELLSEEKNSYDIESWFKSKDITNNFDDGSCRISCDFNRQKQTKLFEIKVIKRRYEKGLKFDKNPKQFANELKAKILSGEIKSTPIIVYFNVNRTRIVELPKKNSSINNPLLLSYENSLSLNLPSFSTFEKWFINSVIEENELKVNSENFEVELPSLKFIRNILEEYLTYIEPNTFGKISTSTSKGKYPDFEVETQKYITIEKHGKKLSFNQLSHGERMMLGMVCETARRLFLANPEDPKLGSGIILIDELELHLHPKWQLNIIKAFEKSFPNLSIIFTTHSPLVLSGLRRESIKIIQNGIEITNEELPDIYSDSADEILFQLMESANSNSEYDDLKSELDTLFMNLEFEKAFELLKKVKSQVASNPSWLNDYEQKLLFAIS